MRRSLKYLLIPYFLETKTILRVGIFCRDVPRSFEGPSISIAHRPAATQIIRQPTESCSGQTSPSPHTQYPPIHPHPSSPSSLAVHNGDKLGGICSVQGRKDTPTLCQIVSPVLKKDRRYFSAFTFPY